METETKIVRLTVPEVFFAMCIAAQRDACKPTDDVRRSRLSRKHSGFGVHFAGVVGELCFRRIYGGKINQQILPNGDLHAPDVRLPDGRCVEVKTSLFNGSQVEIKFENDEVDHVEHCSLVQVTLPDSGIVYPIWPMQELVGLLRTKNYGYGPRQVFCPKDTNGGNGRGE